MRGRVKKNKFFAYGLYSLFNVYNPYVFINLCSIEYYNP